MPEKADFFPLCQPIIGAHGGQHPQGIDEQALRVPALDKARYITISSDIDNRKKTAPGNVPPGRR